MNHDSLKPRRHRYPTELRAHLQLAGGPVPALLTDLSEDGFCVHSDEPLLIGQRVELTEDRLGTLSGLVRWAFNGRAGCRFIDPNIDN